MSNSKLVSYVKISPNRTSPRADTIKKITIHHMACNGTLEAIGNAFANPDRQCSSNYAVDSDGNVAMYCEEKDRSWCSSSANNDHQAITIEVANDGGADTNWHVSDKALEKTIDLCVDICKRNGIKKLNFTGDKNGNLTMHRYFTATECPGEYLASKFPYIQDEVNKKLNDSGTLYRVQIGAYSVKSNAEKQLKLAKDKGFSDAFIVEVGTSKPTPTPTFKSVDEVAKEVIQGDWGNGAERKEKLINAGYDYNEVQRKVEALI